MAWSEDEKDFYFKASEAEAAALEALPSMTLLRTNLAFGPESHLVHYLAQCALVGKSPYKNLVSPDNKFEYSPIHTNDIADAVGAALTSSGGWYSLNGPDKLTLRQMMDSIEEAAGRSVGQTKGPLFPPMTLLWNLCMELEQIRTFQELLNSTKIILTLIITLSHGQLRLRILNLEIITERLQCWRKTSLTQLFLPTNSSTLIDLSK